MLTAGITPWLPTCDSRSWRLGAGAVEVSGRSGSRGREGARLTDRYAGEPSRESPVQVRATR